MRSDPACLTGLLARAERSIGWNQLETAASIYMQALSLAPADASLHRTVGLVRFEQGQIDRALFHLGRAIELDPCSAVSYRSMGDALAASGQSALALAAYGRACDIDPANTDAWLNLGNLWHSLDKYHHAGAAFEKIVDRCPDHVRALNNLGKVHHDMGRYRRSMRFYNKCLAVDPDYAEARFNRAALLLSMGSYKLGWSEYEWRFKRSGAVNVYPHRLRTPRWQGEDYREKRLLVHCEQGMGDVLQFVRYLPMVKRLGGTLLLEAHAPLVPLLRTQPGIDELVVFDPRRPVEIRHDMHIPLMSLPQIFGTTLDTIPVTTPYITIAPGGHKPWQAHVSKEMINIGLVWSASDLNPKRNCPVRRCGAWFRNPALNFIGLQTGRAAGRIEPPAGSGSRCTTMRERLKNFHDTASIIHHLDLVISVDTATAHLAGAMGKPLWVLLPHNADWRWPPHCKRNPWYPGARLFRQPRPGHWAPVIDEVAAALMTLKQ